VLSLLISSGGVKAKELFTKNAEAAEITNRENIALPLGMLIFL